LNECFARAFDGHVEKIAVNRPSGGTYVKGRWQTQDTEALEIEAVVQPLRPEEILRLEDSRHIQEAIKMYTMTELFTVDLGEKRQPDIVTWCDREFEVQSVANWTSFWKVIAVRRETP
jgi:hypothetical protein